MAVTTIAGGKGKVAKGKGKPAKGKPAKGKPAKQTKEYKPLAASNLSDKERKAVLTEAKGEGGTIAVPVPPSLRSHIGKPDGVKFGRKTGLPICYFAWAMFLANDKHKANDTRLHATMLAEFDGRETVQPISAWRAYHNSGKHNCGDGKHVAENYRDDGTVRGSETVAPKGKGKGK